LLTLCEKPWPGKGWRLWPEHIDDAEEVAGADRFALGNDPAILEGHHLFGSEVIPVLRRASV
jgi:hypothetical protein